MNDNERRMRELLQQDKLSFEDEFEMTVQHAVEQGRKIIADAKAKQDAK